VAREEGIGEDLGLGKAVDWSALSLCLLDTCRLCSRKAVNALAGYGDLLEVGR
jgi:hypothetical protein